MVGGEGISLVVGGKGISLVVGGEGSIFSGGGIEGCGELETFGCSNEDT